MRITKYEKIANDLREQIINNNLKPNQVLQSENEMCKHYGVSRVTVRRAIDELCADGLLYRIKGKGCFVKNLIEHQKSRIYSFSDAVKNEGKKPGKKQLSLIVKKADKYLADKLQIAIGDEVFEIKSLYYADDIPYSFNTSILPVKLFNKLDFFDFNNQSLYEVLGSFYDVYMYRVTQTLEATIADSLVYELLKINEGQPLLRIRAVSYCLDDIRETPIEYYESYILTDVQSYYVEKFSK